MCLFKGVPLLVTWRDLISSGDQVAAVCYSSGAQSLLVCGLYWKCTENAQLHGQIVNRTHLIETP